jgi:predicted alpha/beta superfamily hydrolase
MDSARTSPVILGRTESWTFAATSGVSYSISVALPRASPPKSGYPVLYVLDPHTAFATLVDWVRNHEAMYGPVVVVGVGYAGVADISRRVFDLTPTTDVSTLPAIGTQQWGALGGADAFLDFLRDALRSEIAKRIAVDLGRHALVGHSLGGLFVLRTLFRFPDAFDCYAAGSPSIWWADKMIMREFESSKANSRDRCCSPSLLITVGELEAGVSPEELRAAAQQWIDLCALRRHSRMVENASFLASQLNEIKMLRRFAFAKFEGETHTSVIPAFLGRAARFILSSWFD